MCDPRDPRNEKDELICQKCGEITDKLYDIKGDMLCRCCIMCDRCDNQTYEDYFEGDGIYCYSCLEQDYIEDTHNGFFEEENIKAYKKAGLLT